MRRYLEHAIVFDFLICVVVILGLYFGKPWLNKCIHLKGSGSMKELGDALITVSATLIGFLLTIITVIVTFKKGFEDKPPAQKEINENDIPYNESPKETVFDKKISKEEQFYGSDIHKNVANVFIDATYETGFLLFILLGMKVNVVELPSTFITILTITALIFITLAAIRSFYIFKLFLKVHLHDK